MEGAWACDRMSFPPQPTKGCRVDEQASDSMYEFFSRTAIDWANRAITDRDVGGARERNLIAYAQVWATLTLAEAIREGAEELSSARRRR